MVFTMVQRSLPPLDQQIEEFVTEQGPCNVATLLMWFCDEETGGAAPEEYVRGRVYHLVVDDASPVRFDSLLRLTSADGEEA